MRSCDVELEEPLEYRYALLKPDPSQHFFRGADVNT
jgi:hypothetical protein